jgi:hypothetical protein
MSGPRILACPSCGGPVRYEVAFCAYCRAPLTWERPIALERGAALVRRAYPSDPLLGADMLSPGTWERRPDGHAIRPRPGGFVWAQAKLQAADLAASVEGVALDRDGSFGVCVRAYHDGPFLGAYVAMVAPGFRSVRLVRLVEGGAVSEMSKLMDWTSHPCVAPVGQPNQVELRTADTLFQLFVNGTRVLSISHAGIGFGAYGWRVASLDQAATVILRRMDVFEIEAG